VQALDHTQKSNTHQSPIFQCPGGSDGSMWWEVDLEHASIIIVGWWPDTVLSFATGLEDLVCWNIDSTSTCWSLYVKFASSGLYSLCWHATLGIIILFHNSVRTQNRRWTDYHSPPQLARARVVSITVLSPFRYHCFFANFPHACVKNNNYISEKRKDEHSGTVQFYRLNVV